MAQADREVGSRSGSRTAEVAALIRTVREGRSEALDGTYRALAALITDAVIAVDRPALIEARAALQDLVPHQLEGEPLAGDAAVGHGRALALLDTVDWTLRRLTPKVDIAPGSQAGRCLVTLATFPGVYSGQLADLINIDDTQMSRLGRKLLRSGMVRKRKLGKHALWDLTPRGRAAAESLGAAGTDTEPIAADASGPAALFFELTGQDLDSA